MPVKAYDITPIGYVRTTRKGHWTSQAYQNYKAFRDEVVLNKVWFPKRGARITFIMPMPASWSKKKKAKMHLGPHEQKPDLSNLLKAIEDSVYNKKYGVIKEDDSKISGYASLEKLWGLTGRIVIGW